MEVNIEGGLPLKHFTRALNCLTKFGDELDVIVSRDKCSFSTVNSSRTAFAVLHFFPSFFQDYQLNPGADSQLFKFSVNGKALLSPLRPKSVNTIESVEIQVGSGSEDPNLRRLEPGVDAGECRIIVRLNCQHGVVKTHRLTYSNPNVGNWARFDKSNCTSTWKASSKILKEWTDHFYLKTGTHTFTDEITFYCSELACRLKSFVDTSSEQNLSENEIMTSRPLTTELSIATEDFDLWDVSNRTVVTFALKEFKAIVNLSEALSLPITAHFTEGGRPLMVEVEGDYLEAKFVIATSNYDAAAGSVSNSSGSSRASAATEGSVKREKSESISQRQNGRRESTSGSERGGARKDYAKLFNTPTPSPAPQPRPVSTSQPQEQQREQEEDDYDYGGFEDDAAAFAEIDQLSQAASQRQSTQEPVERTTGGGGGGGAMGPESSGLGYSKTGVKILVKDTSEALPSEASDYQNRYREDTEGAGNRSRLEEDEEFFGRSPEPGTVETVLGPTQGYPEEDPDRPRKKSKWNILDDE
ncbi:uncharacterized protein JCM6883_006485 [Sporobolomyces salmoneus]|uniref:uncharacterized protein n=1 Tax=Sporobolomyces salmoneus TaxID=183962 RepID=UPI00317F6DD3